MPSKALQEVFYDWTCIVSKPTCLSVVCLLLLNCPWETHIRDSLWSTDRRVTKTELGLTRFLQVDFTQESRSSCQCETFNGKVKVNALRPAQDRRSSLSLSVENLPRRRRHLQWRWEWVGGGCLLQNKPALCLRILGKPCTSRGPQRPTSHTTFNAHSTNHISCLWKLMKFGSGFNCPM